MLVQVYVDDIIFGSTKSSMVKDFEDLMQKEFKMSSMGELTFFLGLQVKQTTAGIFLSQDKYVKDILNKFNFRTIKPASTLIEAHKSLGKDEEGEDVDVHLYSDYAGDNHDRRSTSGGCQYLGRRLVSWQCKKQTIVAISSTEAEYVAAASCCAQVLWMQNQLLDYGFNFMNTEIHIDNESTICIVKNPVFHSKTKHIQIRHHFIRDCYEQRLINVVKVHTDDNVADLLTKGFDLARFNFLVWLKLMQRDAQSTPDQSAAQARISQGTADVQDTPSQSAAHDSNLQGTAASQGTASIQGTAASQGTARPQGTAAIPKSPNDYTHHCMRLKHSGGEGWIEGTFGSLCFKQGSRRLKKQTLSQSFN
ncbi:putative ribonuclease H-like domain-containing protein [Tanacetum coccineum]|uniref:Ribonuclease H-like domain-containing protein n=1 Tax=Tanacetum coccineum TaxID=301880 RepID=A0ABQ5D215_9ASTR